MNKDGTKTVKYICPNQCGSFRMLNARVSLALCHKPNCNMVMMIPLSQIQKQMRPRRKESDRPKEPFVCCKCGNGIEQDVRVLTIIDYKKNGICYDCLQNYKPVQTWKSHSKSSSG